MKTNYDKFPVVQVTERDEDCVAGWEQIAATVQSTLSGRSRAVLAVECYPGVDLAEIERELVARLRPDAFLRATDALKSASELEAQFAPSLGDDPVFARMLPWTIADFLAADRLQSMRAQVRSHVQGLMVVLGTGAVEVAGEWDGLDVLIYADLARWEIQRRQRETDRQPGNGQCSRVRSGIV